MAATHDKDFGQQLESALFHGEERKKGLGLGETERDLCADGDGHE